MHRCELMMEDSNVFSVSADLIEKHSCEASSVSIPDSSLFFEQESNIKYPCDWLVLMAFSLHQQFFKHRVNFYNSMVQVCQH